MRTEHHQSLKVHKTKVNEEREIRNIPDVRNPYFVKNLKWDSYLSRNSLTSTRTKSTNYEYVSARYVMRLRRQNVSEKARTYHEDRSLWTFMLRMLNFFTLRELYVWLKIVTYKFTPPRQDNTFNEAYLLCVIIHASFLRRALSVVIR